MSHIYFVVFLPLIASIIAGINSRVISSRAAEWLTSLCLIVAAILSWVLFYDVAILKNSAVFNLFNWINSGDFAVKWSLRLDSLTAVMLVVVNTVSALVHIYSVGYMHNDKHIPRFMSYLSLFTFFMLVLVTSNNFLQLFVGWEGVGLCSYLLIGFWFEKDSANNAAIKAFIVNRVGDFGLALGIMLIYISFGSIDFNVVFTNAHDLLDNNTNLLGFQIDTITLICILLFIGAMGKSAQIGLHTWLPDAMEGPTPVSALIHAATMVTAGVFLVARCSPLYELSPVALGIVTIVGAITSIFAATIALTQNDIKKIIAYSTCSQLGYMFFACGVSAYSAAIFHLMTHAFFKALLFLGAGSVIHAMSNSQDIREMGGLWKKIPFTHAMMLIGSIAIVGLPPFSGYYSKDLILESAYGAIGHRNFAEFAFYLGIIAAFCTAFYSWRLLILTFYGKCRASDYVQKHIHESPKIMTIPLLVLSIGAICVGFIGVKTWNMVDAEHSFWNGVIAFSSEFNAIESAHHVGFFIKILPIIITLSGIILAYMLYLKYVSIPKKIVSKFKLFYLILINKYYFDQIYNIIFVKFSKKLGLYFWKYIDKAIIDDLGPNGLSAISYHTSTIFKKLQTGLMYHYAFVMLIGLVGIISWFLFNLNF